jgi:hypothetical protein
LGAEELKMIARTLLVSLALLASAGFAHAKTVSCYGSFHSPGKYIHGDCSHGTCRGWIPSESHHISGSCSGSGVSFKATAYEYSDYITGDCKNGQFRAYLGTSSLHWSGSCTKGGNFSANSTVFGGYLTGSCTENGSFTAYASSNSQSVHGQCTGVQD